MWSKSAFQNQSNLSAEVGKWYRLCDCGLEQGRSQVVFTVSI